MAFIDRLRSHVEPIYQAADLSASEAEAVFVFSLIVTAIIMAYLAPITIRFKLRAARALWDLVTGEESGPRYRIEERLERVRNANMPRGPVLTVLGNRPDNT